MVTGSGLGDSISIPVNTMLSDRVGHRIGLMLAMLDELINYSHNILTLTAPGPLDFATPSREREALVTTINALVTILDLVFEGDVEIANGAGNDIG